MQTQNTTSRGGYRLRGKANLNDAECDLRDLLKSNARFVAQGGTLTERDAMLVEAARQRVDEVAEMRRKLLGGEL